MENDMENETKYIRYMIKKQQAEFGGNFVEEDKELEDYHKKKIELETAEMGIKSDEIRKMILEQQARLAIDAKNGLLKGRNL
jgi:hypothetical protein